MKPRLLHESPVFFTIENLLIPLYEEKSISKSIT